MDTLQVVVVVMGLVAKLGRMGRMVGWKDVWTAPGTDGLID